MKVNKGEIWLANLNPRMGTEPGKFRPVVIVQSDLINEYHDSTIVCPVTSQVDTLLQTIRVHLSDKSNGLDKPSDILPDQIRAIDKKRLKKRLGAITATQQNKLHTVLSLMLNL